MIEAGYLHHSPVPVETGLCTRTGIMSGRIQMKVLHILRSAPDEMTQILIEKTHVESQAILLPIFEGDIDYTQLIRKIFEADEVISWW